MSERLILLALPALLAACNNMVHQPKYQAFGEAPLFADGKAMQPPPEGTIAREAVASDRPLPLTAALLARGRERYDVYCAMCHGLDGSGAGTIVARGFPAPAAFTTAPQRALGAPAIVTAIANGHGVMYAMGDRVAPADRWAIASYVLALQRLGR